jgi:hypothetical protein
LLIETAKAGTGRVFQSEIRNQQFPAPLRPHSHVLEEVANEAVCGAYEILLALLGFPHFCPALALRLGDALTGILAQDAFTSSASVGVTEGT